MNKKRHVRARKSERACASRAGEAGQVEASARAPATPPRGEVTIFLAWLATSNLGQDGSGPVR